MKSQEEILEDVDLISQQVNDELTDGLVRHSNCFPTESGYCSGVDSALEKFIEILKERYIFTEKIQ